MKKLPKIYQNTINKNINNNKKVCYLKNIDEYQQESKSIEDTLDTIFNGMGYAYNIPVVITTKNKVYNTSLISKTKDNIITLDNDVISLSEVLDIKIDKDK